MILKQEEKTQAWFYHDNAAFSGHRAEGGFLWPFLLVRKWKAAEGDVQRTSQKRYLCPRG